MKRLTIFSLLVMGTLLLGQVSFAENDSSQQTVEVNSQNTDLVEAMNAGFTKEQFTAIMEIPELPSEDDSQLLASRVSMTDDQTKIINMAKKQIGKPYGWGAQGPNSFDCGGLVRYVYNNAVGINIPMGTETQRNYGKAVSMNSLLPGDLLFWLVKGTNMTEHVAIYIGNGQFIHSPQPGQNVSIVNLNYLNKDKWYPSFARRILKDAPIPVPVAKFKKGEKLRLLPSATLAGTWSSKRKIEAGYYNTNLTVVDVANAPDSGSNYQYGVKDDSGKLGNIWITENDLVKAPIFSKEEKLRLLPSATLAGTWSSKRKIEAGYYNTNLTVVDVAYAPDSGSNYQYGVKDDSGKLGNIWITENDLVKAPPFSKGEKLWLLPNTTLAGTWSSKRKIEAGYYNTNLTVVDVAYAPDSGSNYQYGVKDDSGKLGNIWLVEKDLIKAPLFLKNQEVQLLPSASLAGTWSSKRKIDLGYYNKKLKILDIAYAPDSGSNYQYGLKDTTGEKGNIWILEHDLKR